MALTATAAWLASMSRANCEPRYLVAITDGVTTWKATDGRCSAFQYNPGGVVSVQPFSLSLDPITRETSIGETSVDFADAFLRPIMVANFLKGQKIAISIGTADIGESDFLLVFTGVIDDLIPDGQGQVITASVLDMFTMMADKDIMGIWIDRHPIEALYAGDGTGVLERVGVTALLDTATFDPSIAAYDDISHFNCKHDIIDTPTSGLALAKQICTIINASMIPTEAGLVKLARFDPDAASVADWTQDDLVGPIEIEGLFEHLANQITVKTSQTYTTERAGQDWVPIDVQSDYEIAFTDNNETAQALTAYLGGADRVVAKEIGTDWLHQRSLLIMSSDPAYAFIWAECPGISGTVDAWAGQAAWQQVSAANPVYLLIADGIQAPEIIKAESAVFSTAAHVDTFPDPNNPSATLTWYYPSYVRFGTLTREMFGTSSPAWWYGTDEWTTEKVFAWVHDITAHVYLARRLLERTAYGVPVLRVATRLCEADKQIGDLVTVTDSKFVAYGLDGLTSSQKFEIIEKEVDLHASPPVAKWKLAYATTNVPGASSRAARIHLGPHAYEAQAAVAQDLAVPIVVDGFAVTDGGGLVCAIAAGVLSQHPLRAAIGATTRTLTATVDTWIAVSIRFGKFISFRFAEVAVLDPEPDKFGNETWLATVTTNAGAITGIVDRRSGTAIHGSKLIAGTGPLAHLSTAGALDNLTSITARSLDNITDGATYSRVKGVGLTAGVVNETGLVNGAVTENKLGALAVTAGKIGAGAVISTKVGEAAIGAHQSITTAYRTGLGPNPDFRVRNRG